VTTALHSTPAAAGGATRGTAGATRRRRAALAMALLLLAPIAALAWAALAPIELGSRDELFEIPRGTWARRMAGDAVEILPEHDPAHARPQRRAAAPQRRRRAAGVRPGAGDAGTELPLPFATASTYASRAARTRAGS
jgi:hypothetical protein